MFIDQAHDKENRPFSWLSNNREYSSNWAPIQPHAEVGLGIRGGVSTNVGDEWMSSTWPRGTVRCQSEVYVPAAGYYTISLRYNSVHYLGFASWRGPGGIYDWQERMAPFDAQTGSAGGNVPAYGMPLVARFEASGIQAVAQLGRTAQSNDASSSQFT